MVRAVALSLALLSGALALVALADLADAASVGVNIQGSRFLPSEIEVRVGDLIRWTNNDGFAHTATAENGGWDTGSIPGNGAQGSVVMDTAGTYPYLCRFHPNMRGIVHVVGEAENSAPTVAITSPPAGTTLQGTATILGTAADVDNDPVTVSLRIDTGAWQTLPFAGGTWNFRWDTTGATNGAHTISVRASDGRVTTQAPTISVNVSNPPSIVLTAPSPGANLTLGARVNVTGTAGAAPGSNLTVQLSIDDGPWLPVAGAASWRYVWNTSGESEGAHTLRARVHDGTIQVLTEPLNVTLVEPPPPPPNAWPSLDLMHPREWADLSGLVNVSGTANDTDGTTPTVEISLAGGAWQPVSGRAGDRWWHTFIPPEGTARITTIEVRVSDGLATRHVLRNVTISPPSRELVLSVAGLAREGSPLNVTVLDADGATPARGVRVQIGNLTKDTNASGAVSFPSVEAGEQTIRAFGVSSAGELLVQVKRAYDVKVSPPSLDFANRTPIRVEIDSDLGSARLPVQLRGDPLPGNASETLYTGAHGTAIFFFQPLHAGTLAVWVAGNDSGERVEITPLVLAKWNPPEPVEGDLLEITFALNDRARSPAAGARVTFQTLEGDPVEAVADATGTARLPLDEVGRVRIEASLAGARTARLEIPIGQAPAQPELSDLQVRGAPGRLDVAVRVTNLGPGTREFTVDALATTTGNLGAGETLRTRALAPFDEELLLFRIFAGPESYEVNVSARGSDAWLAGQGTVVETGIPPTPDLPTEEDALVQEPEPTQETPAPSALAALLVAALATLVARRGRAGR